MPKAAVREARAGRQVNVPQGGNPAEVAADAIEVKGRGVETGLLVRESGVLPGEVYDRVMRNKGEKVVVRKRLAAGDVENLERREARRESEHERLVHVTETGDAKLLDSAGFRQGGVATISEVGN